MDYSKRKPVVETIAGSRAPKGTKPEKEEPKMKKVTRSAPPEKKEPAKSRNPIMEDHAKKNMVKGLAATVKKRQGNPNIKSTLPVSMDTAISKVDSVRKTPEFQQKFKEQILQVPMTGITSRENYAKIIAEREKMFGEARKQNVMDEWSRLNTEVGARNFTDKQQERIQYLERKYHDFDERRCG